MNEPITDEERAAWGRLADEAPEGTWLARGVGGSLMLEEGAADFVLAARLALPRLLAENAELRAALAGAEAERDTLREMWQAAGEHEKAIAAARDAANERAAAAEAKLADAGVRVAQLEHGYDTLRTALHRTEAKLAALEFTDAATVAELKDTREKLAAIADIEKLYRPEGSPPLGGLAASLKHTLATLLGERGKAQAECRGALFLRDDLHAALRKAEAKLAEATAATRAVRGTDPAIYKENAELRARVGALREALRKYGRHAPGCRLKPDTPIVRALQPKGVPFVAIPCDCGLSIALAAGPTAPEERHENE